MITFDQNKLIDKLNDYLLTKKSPKKLPYGYCHGLSLLWLHHMSLRTESSFYRLIFDIISLPPQHYPSFEHRIEELITRIEWLQNPNEYDKKLRQFDVEILLEMPSKVSFSGVFNHRDLNKLLKSILSAEKMICLSGIDHSIGIYCRDNNYHIYDPNYPEGQAKIFSDIKSLTDEIFQTTLSTAHIPASTLSLFFNIVTCTRINNALDELQIKKQLTNSYAQLTRKDALGNNSLHLAAENGDLHAINMLLDNGANINSRNFNQETALLTASKSDRSDVATQLLVRGANVNAIDINYKTALHNAANNNDLDTVKILLKHNALVDPADDNNKTPLVYAIENNNIPIIKMLIANNANPLHCIDEDNCILTFALSQKSWRAILFLLVNINNVTQIPTALRSEITAYANTMHDTYNSNMKFFSRNHQAHLESMLTQLLPPPVLENRTAQLSRPPLEDRTNTMSSEKITHHYSNQASPYSFFSLTQHMVKLKENILSATSYLGFKIH